MRYISISYNAIKEGKEILLEGQLGSLKDPDHGIYPMVTCFIYTGSIRCYRCRYTSLEIKTIVTVVKAYSSAVGAGAFVSEIFGDEADELRRRGGDGGEFGATTGRPRRMGWFDCVATKYGCRIQAQQTVAFTVVDVLGYLDKIPVCVGYEIDGEVTTDFPTTRKLEKAKLLSKFSTAGSQTSGASRSMKIFLKIARSISTSLKSISASLSQWFQTDQRERTSSTEKAHFQSNFRYHKRLRQKVAAFFI